MSASCPCRLVSFMPVLCLFVAFANAASLDTSDGEVIVNNWGYRLQGDAGSGGELLPGPIAAASHDLMVIDFARFGDEGSKFTPAEVGAIKQRSGAVSGSGRRVAAAYISIGEASEFRSYWDDTPGAWTGSGQADSPLAAGAPDWLGPVNPDFSESRKVRYWDGGWQDLIYNDAGTGWLDQAVTQGFDAAYLDIVDAYFFWGDVATPAQKRPGDPTDLQDAARRMIDFIVDMTAHARQTNADFFVIPQNGAFILNDADFAGPLAEDPVRRAAFLDAIGGIAVEDVYFRGDAEENNPFGPDAETIAVLKEDFLEAGKPVFAVDYVDDPASVAQFFAATRADGFIPYAAPSRDLDTLGPPVPEPTTLRLIGVGAVALLRRGI